MNLLINAKGAKRIVGDHIDLVDVVELVLIGPNLSHVLFTHQCTCDEIKEITIQWHRDLMDGKFLRRNQLSFIRNMYDLSVKHILFSKETAQKIFTFVFYIWIKKADVIT